MAKSAINRHYDKVHYLRMINNPYYYADSNLPISFGHNKRKISEFICPDDEYFAKRLIEYKRKKLESSWQDNIVELLPSETDDYEHYRESIIEHEDYCYKNNLDPLSNNYVLYQNLGYDIEDLEDFPIECSIRDNNNNYQYSYLLEKPIY